MKKEDTKTPTNASGPGCTNQRQQLVDMLYRAHANYRGKHKMLGLLLCDSFVSSYPQRRPQIEI